LPLEDARLHFPQHTPGSSSDHHCHLPGPAAPTPVESPDSNRIVEKLQSSDTLGPSPSSVQTWAQIAATGTSRTQQKTTQHLAFPSPPSTPLSAAGTPVQPPTPQSLPLKRIPGTPARLFRGGPSSVYHASPFNVPRASVRSQPCLSDASYKGVAVQSSAPATVARSRAHAAAKSRSSTPNTARVLFATPPSAQQSRLSQPVSQPSVVAPTRTSVPVTPTPILVTPVRTAVTPARTPVTAARAPSSAAAFSAVHAVARTRSKPSGSRTMDVLGHEALTPTERHSRDERLAALTSRYLSVHQFKSLLAENSHLNNIFEKCARDKRDELMGRLNHDETHRVINLMNTEFVRFLRVVFTACVCMVLSSVCLTVQS